MFHKKFTTTLIVGNNQYGGMYGPYDEDYTESMVIEPFAPLVLDGCVKFWL